MLAKEMDEELSEFDLKHFCDGNPVYCYYFRSTLAPTRARVSEHEKPLKILPEEIPLPQSLTKEISLKPSRIPWKE